MVRGLLEIPTGRWRAGETPAQALRREVAEETGLRGALHRRGGAALGGASELAGVGGAPAAVVVGAEGAYPALLVTFVCVAPGEPRALPGETADPRWYSRDEVLALLRDRARRFTAVAYAALAAWLGV